MNDILCKQLVLDYCCAEEDVLDSRNHFTEFRPLEGRRRFREDVPCFLKISVVNGKILFSGQSSIIDWCREKYQESGSQWFFEVKELRNLDKKLGEFGYQIGMVHPFFIPDSGSVSGAAYFGNMPEAAKYDDLPGFIPFENVPGSSKNQALKNLDEVSGHSSTTAMNKYEIRWYEDEDIEQFRGDNRFDEAYSFCAEAPDRIGVAAIREGKILGMAGASEDSPTMWQIGINVDKEARREGIGKTLVSLLSKEIQRRGILPYYGTSMSHMGSQKVALRSGFLPAWVELSTEKMK